MRRSRPVVEVDQILARWAAPRRGSIAYRAYFAQRMRAWRARNPDHNKTLKARKQDRVRRARLRVQLKSEVFAVLGGECECCGEQELAFLCVDHRNGGGNHHRAKVGASYRLYYWLRRQIIARGLKQVQRDFRLLCANCNLALAFHLTCPHRRKHNGA